MNLFLHLLALQRSRNLALLLGDAFDTFFSLLLTFCRVSVFTLNGVNEWRDLILKKVELAQAVEILVTADEFQLFLEYLHLSTHTFPKDGKDYINYAAQTFCETDNTQLQLVTSYLSHSLFFTVFFAFPDSTTNSQPPVHPETTLPPDIHQLKASLPSPSCPLLLCQLPSCVKIATLVCGACKSALYCCEDHRQLDWSSNEGQHAVKCVPLVAFDPLTQPIPGTTGAGSAPPEDYWNPDLASICLDVKEMQIISWNCSENKLFLVKVQYALFVEGNTAPVITVYNKDSTVKVNLKPTTPGYAEVSYFMTNRLTQN